MQSYPEQAVVSTSFTLCVHSFIYYSEVAPARTVKLLESDHQREQKSAGGTVTLNNLPAVITVPLIDLFE